MEQTQIEELESLYSEMHKDAYGVKARWISFSSIEDHDERRACLQESLNAIMAQEQQEREAAIVRFEQRIKDTIEMGAWTRDNAIRWIHEAEGSDGTEDHLEWILGLGYGYFRKVAK